jgi:hypothetical protein|tara:strand:- start:226 stop:438 length:213 start_codon:yes stop_codon:yes gene_type:complete
MRKNKSYAIGGGVTPEQEDSRYAPSMNRAPQGMMSSRGMTSAMGFYDGGIVQEKNYANEVKIVDNRKKKK